MCERQPFNHPLRPFGHYSEKKHGWMDGWKKKAIGMACSWFFAIVENVEPTLRLATINTPIIASKSEKLPNMGTLNSKKAALRMTPSRTYPITLRAGSCLPSLHGGAGGRQQVFHGAAFARHCRRCQHYQGHGEEGFYRTGDDVLARKPLRPLSTHETVGKSASTDCVHA